MQIEYQKQPNRNTCGQTCLAMLTGIPVDRVCREIGHRAETDAEELVSFLQNHGWQVAQSFCDVGKMPPVALLFMTFKKKVGSGVKKNGHVVVWYRGVIYDPWNGVHPDYREHVVLGHYLEVSPPLENFSKNR